MADTYSSQIHIDTGRVRLCDKCVYPMLGLYSVESVAVHVSVVCVKTTEMTTVYFQSQFRQHVQYKSMPKIMS